MSTESPCGGTGSYQNLGDAISWLRVIDPRRVLDVGCGFGRWGFLCREFLDIWNGRVYRRDWQVRLIGVDAFETNLKDHHRLIYDEVHGVKVEEFLASRTERFDLVILGDVLEHFPKPAGLEVLRKCMDRASYVLLVLPLGSHWPQQAIYDNPHERHLGIWEEEDILRLRPLVACRYRDYVDRPYLGAVLSAEDPKRLKEPLIDATPSISSRPVRLQAARAPLPRPQAPPETTRAETGTHATLHVALVTIEYPPLFGGGIATYAFHTARVLGECGNRVSVFTKAWSGETPQLANVNVYPVADGPSPGLPQWELNWLIENIRRGEAISRRLAEVHAEHPIDIIEVTDYYHEGLFLDTSGLVCQDGSPVPMVTHFHGPRCVIAGLDGVLPAPLLQAAEQLALADCEFSKTCSPLMRDQANELWPGVGCEFIPAGFYPTEQPPPASPGGFEYDLLYFGKLELRKGMEPLARAIQELLRRGILPSVCFVGRDTDTAPGGGSMAAWLEGQLRSLLGTRLHFKDAMPQDELWRLLANARVIIIPSLWESLGLAAWEAFCSGRPVICSSRVAAASVLDEALARKMVVDTENVHGFATAMADLLKAPGAELDSLAAKARAAVLDACRPDRINALTTGFYRRCMERVRTDSSRQAWRNRNRRCHDLFCEVVRLFADGHQQQVMEHERLSSEVKRLEGACEQWRAYTRELEEARDGLSKLIDEVRAATATETGRLRARIDELQAARDLPDRSLAEAQAAATTEAEQLRARIVVLENARDQLDRSVAEARAAAATEAGQLRARITELEAARDLLGRSLEEGRAVSASEAEQLRTRLTELEAVRADIERQNRHLGLRVAALRAENEYVREELGGARWSLDQGARELQNTASELDATRAALHATQAELSTVKEGWEHIQSTRMFRLRKLMGRALRSAGLRRGKRST